MFLRLTSIVRVDYDSDSNYDYARMDAPKQKYRWPWFVAAAVLVGIVMAVVFVLAAVKKVEQQRETTPLPASKPTP